jgi:hypothetical protein
MGKDSIYTLHQFPLLIQPRTAGGVPIESAIHLRKPGPDESGREEPGDESWETGLQRRPDEDGNWRGGDRLPGGWKGGFVGCLLRRVQVWAFTDGMSYLGTVLKIPNHEQSESFATSRKVI